MLLWLLVVVVVVILMRNSGLTPLVLLLLAQLVWRVVGVGCLPESRVVQSMVFGDARAHRRLRRAETMAPTVQQWIVRPMSQGLTARDEVDDALTSGLDPVVGDIRSVMVMGRRYRCARQTP